MQSLKYIIALLLTLSLVAAACGDDDDDSSANSDTTGQADDTSGADQDEDEPEAVDLTAQGDDVLAAVMSDGVVRCGTRDALPGFAVLQDDGSHVGFDSDFCRVIAAAVLGDSSAVEHIDLETNDRFTALQGGEIDVLVRNTTWTAGRDGNEGATFLQPNFYDGQGMMVETGAYGSVADMDGAVVCVAGGTTSEGNVANEFTRQGLAIGDILSFENTDLLQEAFIAGRCDGWSSDVSQLTAFRSTFPDGPEALTILGDVFSKEPLAPAVRDGQTAWGQAVNWAVFATIQAEEWGITSANVDEFLTSSNPNILKFLGVEVDGAVLDPGLGLPTDFAYQVIKQVGNYGEIYDRNIAPLGLPRGNNALWFDGGQLYAPPYR